MSLPFVPIVLMATANGCGFSVTLKPTCSRLNFAIWAWLTAAADVVCSKSTLRRSDYRATCFAFAGSAALDRVQLRVPEAGQRGRQDLVGALPPNLPRMRSRAGRSIA